MRRTFSFIAAALLSVAALAQPKVVAHRGYWRTDGSAQNSIASLRKAASIGCYGSEFDVWITADGVPVVFHDATIGGIRIEDTTYATLMNHRLANGEFLPTLQQYLSEGARLDGTQLILEVKTHRNDERNRRAADMVVALVKMLGLEQKTEYISFSRVVCQHLHAIAPEAKVAYLKGDLTPGEVKDMGLAGIDYSEKAFGEHPEWIGEAKRLGLEVNVWTVDGEDNLRRHAATDGIDIITTNDPEVLKAIIAPQPSAQSRRSSARRSARGAVR